MIWLASFPRSGNTFVRNILKEVYGLSSSEFHKEKELPLQPDYHSNPFVKTHLLPPDLDRAHSHAKSLYLVRDGRDALVSIAHQRSDIVAPGSDFLINLEEAVIAAKGSFFGGWSRNVQEWIDRADYIIRFEELIQDPRKVFERLEQGLELPKANWSKLPTFRDLKYGDPAYGKGENRPGVADFTQKFFRQGKAGTWKEDMPEYLHLLFWNQHGHMMEKMGYTFSGEILPANPYLDADLIDKQCLNFPKPTGRSRILLEATKLDFPANDGIKRYTYELLSHLIPVAKSVYSDISLFTLRKRGIKKLNKKVLDHAGPSLDHAKVVRVQDMPNYYELHQYEVHLIRLKLGLKRVMPKPLYTALAGAYRALPVRRLLRNYHHLVFWKKQKTGIRDERLEDFDLIHMMLPQNYVHVAFAPPEIPLVCTVHDYTHLHYPEFHEKENVKKAARGFDFLQKRNSHFIAVSGHTGQDIVQQGISPEKVYTVTESAAHPFFKKILDTDTRHVFRLKYELKTPYLLCLGTLEPRKNLENMLKAFALLKEEKPDSRVRLVIAGSQGWKHTGLDKLIANTSGVRWIGFVPEQDLPVLYSEALALCYVSHYEGFGLPIVEAMSCGTPVIYGNNSAMPEVAMEGGMGVSASDVADIKEKMVRLTEDGSLREKMGQAAMQQALQFSWRQTAIQTLDVYRKVLQSAT